MPTNDNLKDENVVITKRKSGAKEQPKEPVLNAGELLDKVLNIITPPAGAAEIPVLPSDSSVIPADNSVVPSTQGVTVAPQNVQPVVQPVQVQAPQSGISQSYPMPTVSPNADLSGGISIDVYNNNNNNQPQQPIIPATPLMPTVPTTDQINNDLMVEIPVEDDTPVTIDVTDTGSANTPVEESIPSSVPTTPVDKLPFLTQAVRAVLNTSSPLASSEGRGLGDLWYRDISGKTLDQINNERYKTANYIASGVQNDPAGVVMGALGRIPDIATGLVHMALPVNQLENVKRGLADYKEWKDSGLPCWEWALPKMNRNAETLFLGNAPYTPNNIAEKLPQWQTVEQVRWAGEIDAPEIARGVGGTLFDVGTLVLDALPATGAKVTKVTSAEAAKAAQDVAMAKTATNFNKAQKTINKVNRTIDKINEGNKEANAAFSADSSYIPRPQITLEDVIRASEEGLDLYDSRIVAAANELENATKQMLDAIPEKFRPMSDIKRQVVQYATRKGEKLFAEYDRYYDNIKQIEKEIDNESRRVADEIGKRYGITDSSKVTVKLEDAGIPKVPEGVQPHVVIKTNKVDELIPDWQKWYTEEELAKLNGKVPTYEKLHNHLYQKYGADPAWKRLKMAGIDEMLNADGTRYSRGVTLGLHDRLKNTISFTGSSVGTLAHEIIHSLENVAKSVQGNKFFKETFGYTSPTNIEQAVYDLTRYIDGTLSVEDMPYLRGNFIAQSEFAEIAKIVNNSRLPELVRQLKETPDYDLILNGVYKQRQGLFRTTLHAFNKVYEYSPEIKAAAQKLRDELGIKYKGKFTPQIVGKMTYEAIADNYRNAGVMLDNLANTAENAFKTDIVDGKLGSQPLVKADTPIEDIVYLPKDDVLNKPVKDYEASVLDSLPDGANPDDYVAIQRDTVRKIVESRTPHEFVSGLLGDIYKIARSSLLGGGTYVGGNAITSAASTATAANLHYLDDIAAALKSRGNLSKDLGIYRYDRPVKYDTRFGEIAGAVNDVLGASVIRRLDRAIQNTATEVAANTALREAGVPVGSRVGDWLTKNLTPEQLGKAISDARNYAVTDSRSIIPKNLNKALSIAFPFIGYQNAALRSTATLLRNHPIATNLIWNWTLGRIGYDQEMQNRYRLGVKSNKPFVTYRANPNTGETMEVSIENVPMITNAKILSTPVQVAEHIAKTGGLQGLNGTNIALDPIFITEVNASLKGEDAYGNQLRTRDIVPAGNGVRYNTKTGQIVRGGTPAEVANTVLTGLVGGTRLINRTILPTGAGIYNALTGDDMTYYLPYADRPIGQFARRSDVLSGRAKSTTGDFTRPRTMEDVFMSLIGGYQRPLYVPRTDPNQLSPMQLRQMMRNQMYYNNKIQKNNQRINP